MRSRGEANRLNDVGDWFLMILHSPVLLHWIVIAGMSVTLVVDLFRAPRAALHLLGLIGLMATLTRFMARRQGVSPWPIRMDDPDDDDDDPPLLDAGAAQPTESSTVGSPDEQRR